MTQNLNAPDATPAASLASIAAELGYSDQAHLAGDFRTVLGLTASEYRAAGQTAPSVAPRRDDTLKR